VNEQSGPQRFRGWIASRWGLHFDDSKLDFLSEILDRRARQRGLMPDPYLESLGGPGGGTELHALIAELTVPETYFFRHAEQLRAFLDVVVPQAQAVRTATRKLSIVSAGCASGEEPYSLAMMLRDAGIDASLGVELRALDINPLMLAKAARGIYSPWALRETPADVQQRWFRRQGRDFELDRTIRSAVVFQEMNLAEDNSELWAPGRHDVIFCRNVLMYFTPERALKVVARLTASLRRGGHLFLGHAETLRGLSSDYHLCHTHGTFYYQRKQVSIDVAGIRGAASREDRCSTAALSESASSPATTMDPAWARTWLDTVQRTSARIQALADRPAVRATTTPASQPVGAATTAGHTAQLQVALALLKQERFSDALNLLASLPAEQESDADVLLLRAALLTHSGQLSAAEAMSAKLLEHDGLNAGAHYLLALCRESAGDRQGAIEHDQTAVYLDSTFAMPRLHLGLLARRAGDRIGAVKELAHALELLKREDASRVLLFGGGFGRQALSVLCAAELDTAGAS
jgi:chemotaxis protein methyltransferase CheR